MKFKESTFCSDQVNFDKKTIEDAISIIERDKKIDKEVKRLQRIFNYPSEKLLRKQIKENLRLCAST